MSIDTKIYKERLEKLRNELAANLLEKPTEKSAFGYGLACGEYRGLMRAAKLLDEVSSEERIKEREGSDGFPAARGDVDDDGFRRGS